MPTPPRPRVSIVIPSHNAAAFLEDCVASAVAQTYPHLEIVIVDDASTDASLALARELAARHGARPIRVLEEHARCSAVTRNTGIAAARGEYVINLDADNMLDPRFAEVCVAALDGERRAAVAYGTWRIFGERTGTAAPRPWDYAALLEANYIDANSMFRRSAWEQVGGFSTDLRYEDWDLWVRFGEAGWIGLPVPEAIFHYRVRADGQNIANAPRNARIRAEFIHRRPHLYRAPAQEWAQRVRTDSGEAPPLPGFRLPSTSHGEPAPSRRVLAFVGEAPGGPDPAPVLAALESAGVPAQVLRAADGASVTLAESLAAAAGAEWLIALNPGECCTTPWPDLDLAGAISFADSLGYDALTGESPDGTARPGLLAWKVAAVRHTVSPVPLLMAPPAREPAAGAALLARSLRDLMVAAAVRGGHAAGGPSSDALARWAGRTAGFDEPVPADVVQAAMSAVEEGGPADGLDLGEHAVLLAAARLREAELRARSDPQAVDRSARRRAADSLERELTLTARVELDARGFAVAVHADELLAAPEVAWLYAEQFDADADATLVVFDCADDTAALERRLREVAGAAGLDRPCAPDVLGVSLEARGDARLAVLVDALLTSRTPSGALSELPRFGIGDLAALRKLAEACWRAGAGRP